MTLKTDATGQIVKREAAPGDELRALIQRMRPEIERSLPRHVRPDRIARIAMTAITNNPKLGQCTPGSFIGCLLQTSQMGLEVNTPLGEAYLIPRNNKNLPAGKLECTLIIGYQGMMKLARNSGEVKDIYADLVREGDEFEYQLGTDRWIKHKPSHQPGREGRKVTHVYCVAELKGGGRPFVVLTEEQIQARRNRSMARNGGPWVTDPDPMRLKTGVRALWPWIPKSAEMAAAEAMEFVTETGRALGTALDPSVVEVLERSALTAGEDAPEAEVEAAPTMAELLDLCAQVAVKHPGVRCTAEVPPGEGKVYFVHPTIKRVAGFEADVLLTDGGSEAATDDDMTALAKALRGML